MDVLSRKLRAGPQVASHFLPVRPFGVQRRTPTLKSVAVRAEARMGKAISSSQTGRGGAIPTTMRSWPGHRPSPLQARLWQTHA